jgi:tetratricopeptide (TPR) repeat protein
MGGGYSTTLIQLKDLGDHHYRAKQFQEAVYYYTAAISDYETVLLTSSDSSGVYQGDSALLLSLYGNRSAAFEILGCFQQALDDALKALDVNHTYSKGYYRAALSLIGLERPLEALEYLEKALALTHPSEHMNVKNLTDLKTSLLRGGGNCLQGHWSSILMGSWSSRTARNWHC